MYAYNVTPHSTTGYAPYFLLFGVEPRLPVDALLGREGQSDNRQDWLSVHQERLRQAHKRAKEYSEQKAAERISFQNGRVHCPPVKIGQLVFLRQRPMGRHKIQDAWGSTVYKIVDIQGTTHSVEPVEGGPTKRVHRSELRLCLTPVPKPRTKLRLQNSIQPVAERVPEPPEPEFVIVEESHPFPGRSVPQIPTFSDESDFPELTQPDLNPTSVTIEGGADFGVGVCSEVCDLTDVGGLRPQPRPRVNAGAEKGSEPIPAIRKSKRTTAGSHSNPFHLPKSTCNAVSVSTDMVSQVLTSLGTALFEKALQGAFHSVAVM